jgi:integrase
MKSNYNLTDTKVKAAKPKEREYKLADGGGLYLLVKPTGAKLWRWKYYFNGKERKLALGVYPAVKIASAREQRDEALALLKKNIDPAAQRQTEKIAAKAATGNSFAAVAEAWHEHWKPNKDKAHADRTINDLRKDVFPILGHRPIDQIEAAEVLTVIKAIEARGAEETARRTFGVVRAVFRYAIAHSRAKHSPVAHLKPAEILKPVTVVNFARVETDDVPELMQKIDLYRGTPMIRLALKLMALTFVRTTELIGARWEEFDLEATLPVWTIPGERMKKPSGIVAPPHAVPLATQTVAILRQLETLTGDGDLLFPGRGYDEEKTISNNTFLQALKRMGYKGMMTGHGFRGVGATILYGEWKTDDPLKEEYIEMQLSHLKGRSTVKGAYNHSKYIKQRAQMMQWYADYLEQAQKQRPHKKATHLPKQKRMPTRAH